MDRSLFEGTWTETEEDWIAFDLWLGYYRDTEAFDVAMGCPPSLRDPGVVPVTPYQRARSSWFAAERRRLLLEEARRRGVDNAVLARQKEPAIEQHERELRGETPAPPRESS